MSPNTEGLKKKTVSFAGMIEMQSVTRVPLPLKAPSHLSFSILSLLPAEPLFIPLFILGKNRLLVSLPIFSTSHPRFPALFLPSFSPSSHGKLKPSILQSLIGKFYSSPLRMPQLFKNELQSCLKLQVCIITTKIVMKSAKSRKPSSKPS